MRPRGSAKPIRAARGATVQLFLCRTVPGSHRLERACDEIVPRERKIRIRPGFPLRAYRTESKPAPLPQDRALGHMCQPAKCSRGSDGANIGAAQGSAGDERAEQVQGWQDRPGPHRIERVCGEMVMREKDDAAQGSALAKNSNGGRAYPGPRQQHRAEGVCVNPRKCSRVRGDVVKSADEEPTGRDLVPIEEKRALESWALARLRSMRQGEREERGNSARREIYVFATFGIVYAEYGDSTQKTAPDDKDIFLSTQCFSLVWRRAIRDACRLVLVGMVVLFPTGALAQLVKCRLPNGTLYIRVCATTRLRSRE
jgi:hypothetical protein